MVMMEIMLTTKNCWVRLLVLGSRMIIGGFKCDMLGTKIPEVLQSLAIVVEVVTWRQVA